MGNCKKCNAPIGAGKVCMSCVNEAHVDLVEAVTKLNWNLGAIAKYFKEKGQ